MNETKPFLTAQWKYLAMLNYEVDATVLEPYVPRGTELDEYNGKLYASVVAFLFQRTRVKGIAIPFHINFEEVNLRFYVRYRSGEEWRRGVVFVKEIVPRVAIAWVARNVYNENYVCLPTRHEIHFDPTTHDPTFVQYEWRHRGIWNSVSMIPDGEGAELVARSEEEFITEHYWGYAAQPDGSTVEYRVAHPSWRVWQVRDPQLQCDVAGIYGQEFSDYLQGPPASAFLAEGSRVEVHRGYRVPL